MFSGIIEEIGQVKSITDSDGGRALKIAAKQIREDLQIGHSVSIAGACLTVVELGEDYFSVEAIHETLRKTTLGDLHVGSKVNLERALKLSDRLGGHLVSGHVDAIGTVRAIEVEGFAKVVTFATEKSLAPFFVEKGSVAVEGVSLTVWGLSDAKIGSKQFCFKVGLIPHTLAVTTLGDLVVGSHVNIETDVVARYVARWLEPSLIRHNLRQPDQSLLSERS